MSDPFYLNDYKIMTVDPSKYYLQDVVSSVYLRGQADRGFFDLSGYRFESRPPPPISASSRWSRRVSTTIAPSRFRPMRRRASAARSRSISTSPTSRASRPPISRQTSTRSTRPTSSMTSARRAARSQEAIEPAERRPGLLFAGQRLSAARHRRRLHARFRAGVLAAQVRRSARRDVDALRLRPARWRDGGAQHRRRLRLGGGSTIYNSGQSNYFSAQQRLGRARDARRRPRISLSPDRDPCLGSASVRADRPAHRSPRRGDPQAAAQRGFAEPGVRRDQPVRLGQVLGL